MRPALALLTALTLLPLLAACGDDGPSLEVVASSTRLWTGVAVSREGRVFVNYPRWSDDVPLSVAELKDGEPVAFPSAEWNRWAPSFRRGTTLSASRACTWTSRTSSGSSTPRARSSTASSMAARSC